MRHNIVWYIILFNGGHFTLIASYLSSEVVWLYTNLQMANYDHFKHADSTTILYNGKQLQRAKLDCKNKTNSREVHTQHSGSTPDLILLLITIPY